MVARLHEFTPVTVSLASGAPDVVPDPRLLANLPLLRTFASLIVDDWQREAGPRQALITEASQDGEPTYVALQAFSELQPLFLKCLFSYAFFYVATESAYLSVYRALARANSSPALRVHHAKPPRRPPLLEKLVHVRNWSIAHLGTAKASKADALAAMSWQPMAWSSDNDALWDVNNISFGVLRVQLKSPEGRILETSTDLELSNLPHLHEHASRFLDASEAVTIEFLENIRARLQALNMTVARQRRGTSG